jgi:hypothetical protein
VDNSWNCAYTHIQKIPRETLAYIVIPQGFWKRVVFVSTNQAYVEQIVDEIKQALGKMGHDALSNSDKVPYALPFPNYSEPRKVADNPNRVFLDREWLMAGRDRYRLDSIQVLKTRSISVWLYWRSSIIYLVPGLVQPLSHYLPADVQKSPAMLVLLLLIPLLIMCASIGFLVFMLVTGVVDQIAYSVIIKLGSQRIIVYSSMDKAQAEAVREEIRQRIAARTIAGYPQRRTTG